MPAARHHGVLLHRGVLEAPADEPLHVEERLAGVDRRLVLRRLADEPLLVREGHLRHFKACHADAVLLSQYTR